MNKNVALALESSLPTVDVRLSHFSSRLVSSITVILGDLFVLQTCVALARQIRESLSPWFPIAIGQEMYDGISAGVLVVPLGAAALRLYPGFGISEPERLRRQIIAIALSFFGLFIWDAVIQHGVWSRGMLLVAWGLATILLPLCSALLIGGLVNLKLWRLPVLIIAPVKEARRIIDGLEAHPYLGFFPIGYLSGGMGGNEPLISSVPYLGKSAEANRFRGAADTVLVANPSQLQPDGHRLLDDLVFPNIIFIPSSDMGQGTCIASCDVGESWGVEIRKNTLLVHKGHIKRVMDCLLGVPLFLLTLPIIAILCVLIMNISPGAPFFSQTREGLNGRPFRMLKLRTMVPNAERRLSPTLHSNAPDGIERRSHIKLSRDPRVLPVLGLFLRKSSLDELPQLWNVVKGDMSLVGPRPLPHYHLAGFGTAFRNLRHSVLPGLSGLWQVEARSDSDLQIQEKLDTDYIRHWSLWLDFYILIRTFSAVLSGRGAR